MTSKEGKSESGADNKRKAEDDLRDTTETLDGGNANSTEPTEPSDEKNKRTKLEDPGGEDSVSKFDDEGKAEEEKMEIDENDESADQEVDMAEKDKNDGTVEKTEDQSGVRSKGRSGEAGSDPIDVSTADVDAANWGSLKENDKLLTGGPKKNPYDQLRWTIVKNDGKPESLIKLVALKSLFAKQLPKMPRAYIARLVFDRRHVSLVILSDDPKVKDTDKEVIGSICYRPFPEMRFAEIAFCAVNSDHQVKVCSN